MVSNAIDMELENTVFLITPLQFSVVRIKLFIQFSNTVQNTSYFLMYMIFSTDFAVPILRNSIDCAVLRDFWLILQNHKIPEGLLHECSTLS